MASALKLFPFEISFTEAMAPYSTVILSVTLPVQIVVNTVIVPPLKGRERWCLTGEGVVRRKIRLIEGNAECRHLKTLTCRGTLRQVFICLRPRTLCPPPITHCIQYTYSHREGGMGGGGESWTREKGRGATAHKMGRKYQHDWLHLQSINSDKHLPQSPFTGQYF
jgi:hypothetical protein